MKHFLIILIIVSAASISACTTAVVPPSNSIDNATQNEVVIPAGHFYFSADNCSACSQVATYIQNHSVRQQQYFIDRKIDSSGTNVDLLKALAKKCGIAEADVSVPLFWDGSRCYEGSDQVIGYFEKSLK